MQKGIMVKTLLDSRIIGLIISFKFARKKGFELKKIEKPIYMRNVDETFNKKGPIEYTVEINIHYQGHKKRIEIGIIRDQK